jgi:uncharacterized repeat protein (TIGR01451 family)
MTRRVRFTPLAAAGAFAVGLAAAAGPAGAAEVPFAPRNVTSAPDAPLAVHALDIDGDGDTDVVSGSYVANEVAWYENDGLQSFTAHTVTTGADGLRSVFAVDVDGDGDVDILSASSRDDRVAWYENDGSQAFTAHTITTAAAGAYSVYALDVDRDGDVDVLSASLNDDTVAWYENDGAESFTAHTITTAADVARSVYACDVDGDGDIDVLSASFNDDKVAWYENDGAQSFTARTVTTAAEGATSVRAADVDGDGDVDILSTSFDDDSVTWYENDGSQGFMAHDVATGADGARSVVAADLDGDGDTDILSSSITDDKVAWYENDGSQSFTTRTISTAADFANAVFVADVDGDGDLDVLSPLRDDDAVAWYENRTIHRSAAFSQGTAITTTANGAYAVFAVDVDGDGDTDVLSASKFDNKVAWYENDGSQSFAMRTITTAANSAGSVYAADVDGDGDTDVLSTWSPLLFSAVVGWYENDGSQNFTAHPIAIVGDTGVPVYAADVDGDGDTDVLSASEDSRVAWHENDGTGSFTTHTITTEALAVSVYAADVDGDGDTDILSASPSDDTAAWHENDGSQSFTAHTIATAVYAVSVYAADVDGDGDTDVLSASFKNDKVVWYENDGSQSFTTHTITTAADGAYSVYAADVDGDGDMDVLSASVLDDTVAWYENDGAQSFTTHTITIAADGVGAVYAADVDGDGDMDVLSASAVDDTVAWYENVGGQFALPTIDMAPLRSVDGASEAMLGIVATHRGRAGDADVELATLDLLFESEPGVAYDSASANALVDSLHVYLDSGSGLFEAGSDTLVTTVPTLSLTAGRQTVSFADGDADVRIALGFPRTYFLVVNFAADAHLQPADTLRLTHLTSSTSTGEDAEHDTPLSLETLGDTASTTVDVNDPPGATTDGAVTLEDGTLTVAAPGILVNDTDEELDLLNAVLAAGPAHAAAFALQPDGSFSYTPAPDFGGFDSFQYRAADPLELSDIASVLILVQPIADPPSLVLSDAAGPADTAIPLTVSAALADTDGSESLLVTFAAIPAGASLSTGTDLGGGVWELTPGDLSGLTITPPPGSDADFTLAVTAESTEILNGDTATSSGFIDVTVDASLPADLGVTLDDGGGVVIEGTTLTYTITVANSGPNDVTGATVIDTFPPELTGVSWTCTASSGSSCSGSGSGNLSTAVDLLSGGTATFTASGTAPPSQAAPLSNTATVTVPAGVVDPVSANDSATVETFVALFADGFESGDTSAWSSAIPPPALLLIVENEAAYEPRVYRGRIHLETLFPDDRGETTRAIVVREAEGAPHRLGLFVTRRADAYRVRAWAPVGEDVRARITPPVELTERPREISFEWIGASGPGAEDGMLRLFVDGRPAGTLEGLSGR